MKTLGPTFVFVLISFITQASDWSFNYLNKLYQKNPELCYKRCKSFMNLFPHQESAYFFAMKIQIAEAETSTKTKSQGARMIKAIDYARYFEENASSELKAKTQWDTIQGFLFNIASEIRQKLDDENLNSNIKQLDSKWEKFAGNPLKTDVVEDKKVEIKP